MHLSRTRRVAGSAALLLAAGGVLAAGSFASGASHVPAVAGRTAAGTAQRTFVSAATGNDANPCSRTAPCRNFAAAIAQTAAGGEVIVLDSGGYGTVTISQSVSLISPPGVYAGITAFSGNAIEINAGASDSVTLRGLTPNGLGGGIGLNVDAVGRLFVDDV